MKIFEKLLLCFSFVCIFNVSAFSNDNVKAKGPLLTSNLYPLYLPYINMKPERASSLESTKIKSSLSLNYANNCHYDEELLYENYTLLIDMEIYEAALNLDYGFSDKFDAGISLSYAGAYEGISDPVIASFHKIFNLPNGHRDDVSDNDFYYYIENTEGEYLRQDGAFSGINNILLRFKYSFWENDAQDFVMALRYGLKIPNSSDFGPLSSGKMDHSLNLLAEKSFNYLSFYSGVGFIYLAKPDNLEIFGFKEILFDYFITAEFMSSEKFSLFFQFDGSSSPYNTEVNHEYIDLHSATTSYGLKYETKPGHYLAFSFMEEGVSFAAIDIGVTLSYEMIF